MTPWAHALALGLSRLVGRPTDATAGMELLHLVGNSITAAALLAAVIALRAAPWARWVRLGAGLQGFHLAEHATLTVSWLVVHRAIGMSTGFGLIPAGPWLWSYRVWWHFLVNLAVTLVAVAAISGGRRARRGSGFVPHGRGAAAHDLTSSPGPVSP